MVVAALRPGRPPAARAKPAIVRAPGHPSAQLNCDPPRIVVGGQYLMPGSDNSKGEARR